MAEAANAGSSPAGATPNTTQPSVTVAQEAVDGPNHCLDDIMGVNAEEQENKPDGLVSARNGTNGISEPKKKSGVFGASSNLVNSIVGAGIIGIPYALRQAGLVAGVFLLVLVAYMTDKSLRTIVELASFHPKLKNRGVVTFEDLISYPFGRWGSAFILLSMFVLAYGAMVAYLLIIKDTVPTILGVSNGKEGGVERELIMVGTSLLIIVPLSIQRDMASLAFTSVLSVLADIILVGFIVGFSPIGSSVSNAGGFGRVLQEDWLNPTIFIGLGILSTAMACQHSAFIVSGSLMNKTRARWAAVTFRSISISALLCILLGVFGYLGFLDETDGNILNNFPGNSPASNGARALLAITMFFTYPMECFVARHVLVKLFFKGDLDGPLDENGKPVRQFIIMGRREAVTIGIYILTLIPSLIVDDLGPVLSITGSLGGSCLSYIAPGIVYLGVNGDHFKGWVAGFCNGPAKKKEGASTGDIELPVAGDANRTMETPHPSEASAYSLKKPWWWYPAFMPVWYALASSGSKHMEERLQREEALFQEMRNGRNGQESENTDEVHPSAREYLIAIFFIVFGIVGAVAGIVSNVYVQINQLFFTPT